MTIRHLWSSDRDSNGNALTKPFGGRNDVWLHIPMLNTKPLGAGTSPASLHLVSDKQTAVLTSNLSNSFKVPWLRNDETTDTENRFSHERCDLAHGSCHD